jgi:hypothetical protein
MQTSKEIQGEIERLEAQKSDLESKQCALRTEAGGLEDLRRELAPKAFLGDGPAAKQLEILTSKAVRSAHDEQNLQFALEAISGQLQDARAHLVVAERRVKEAELAGLVRRYQDLAPAIAARLNEFGEAVDQARALNEEIAIRCREFGLKWFDPSRPGSLLQGLFSNTLQHCFPGIHWPAQVHADPVDLCTFHRHLLEQISISAPAAVEAERIPVE